MNKKLLFILIPIAVLLFAGMIVLLVILGGNTTPDTTENPTSTNAPINQIPSDNLPHVITENIVLTGEEIVIIKIAPIGQGNYKENKIILYPDGQVLNITFYEDETMIAQKSKINQSNIDAILKLCNDAESFDKPSEQCTEGSIYYISCPKSNLKIESCGLCSPEAIDLFYNIKKILLSEGVQ